MDKKLEKLSLEAAYKRVGQTGLYNWLVFIISQTATCCFNGSMLVFSLATYTPEFSCETLRTFNETFNVSKDENDCDIKADKNDLACSQCSEGEITFSTSQYTELLSTKYSEVNFSIFGKSRIYCHEYSRILFIE